MTVKEQTIEKFIAAVDRAQTIALFSHVNPDGDTCGSALALYRALKTYGKTPYVFCDGVFGDKLHYLDGLDNYNSTDFKPCDLAIAAGRDKDGSQKAEAGKAKEQFYFRVDQPFREWLRTIDPMRGEEENKILQWQNQAAQLARRFGEELVREAGTRALIGRSIEDRSKKGKNETSVKRHYSAPEAYNAFLSRIAVIYGKGGTA